MFWQRTVKESLEYAESTINNVREPLIALNKKLNVISVSRRNLSMKMRHFHMQGYSGMVSSGTTPAHNRKTIKEQ
jgi:hypothetical protein